MAGPEPAIAVVVPALEEGAAIAGTLAVIRRQLAAGDELIVVDGGSRDDTVAQARAFADRVIEAPPGRARQMNRGAEAATATWLWFVHADTGLAPGAVAGLRRAVADRGHGWGRFDVRLSGRRPIFRLIAALMNLRSRLTGIATGDQGIFVERRLFRAVGGFPEQPLMEDIALSARLRREARPLCLPALLCTSSRRWETNGVMRTVVLMWRLRWAYWRGADAAALARRYRGAPS